MHLNRFAKTSRIYYGCGPLDGENLSLVMRGCG